MKIKTLLFTFNRPDLLVRQVDCIRKNIKNLCDIIIIHDSRNNEFVDEFEKICTTLDVKFFHHNSEEGCPSSYYHADCAQWAYETLVTNDDEQENIFLFLDHDMFLIEELDLIEYMNEIDVFGCLQVRGNIKYFWPGMFGFKKKSIIKYNFNFYPQVVDGKLLDTGGGTYNLLMNTDLKYKDSGVEYPDEYDGVDITDESITNGYNYELHLDRKFLHYRNASNWNNNYVVSDDNKTKFLFDILDDIIEE